MLNWVDINYLFEGRETILHILAFSAVHEAIRKVRLIALSSWLI